MICHYLNNINLCVYLVLVILGLLHESMLFPPLSVVHHLPSLIILNALICLWMHIRLIFRALKQKIRGEEEEEGVNGDKFDHCIHPSHFVRYLKKLNTTTSPELEFQSILCPRLFFLMCCTSVSISKPLMVLKVCPSSTKFFIVFECRIHSTLLKY